MQSIVRIGNQQVYATTTPAKCVSPHKNSIENPLLQSLTTTEHLYTFAPPEKEMTHMDPHSNEYAAAVAGMSEHTMPPAPQQTYAVGDFVSGVTAGKSWSGHIQWFSEANGDACIDVGGGWVYVPVKDITF